MLTITNNLDRTDAATISNWPFTFESTLDTGDGLLTGDSFLAISVNVDAAVTLPCRFKGVTSDGLLVICDATGAELCSGKIYADSTGSDICSFFLYDQFNILCGFISCKKIVVQKFWDIARYANGIHYFGTSAFVFLPQCHVQTFHRGFKSYGVQGRYSTANLKVKCTVTEGNRKIYHNLLLESKSPLSYGLYNVADFKDQRNKWCYVVVNGQQYDMNGKHLIIKAGCASNLRVVNTDAAIILRGVKDV